MVDKSEILTKTGKDGKPLKVYTLKCPDKKLAYHEKVSIAAKVIRAIQKYDDDDFHVEITT